MATANNEFFEALSALEKERGLPEDYLIDKIKAAIVIAVKKDYEVEDDNVVVDIDPELGAFRASLLRDIVEEVENPHTQVSLEDAQKVRKSYKVGQRMVTPLKTKEFGRIAAQTAKHVIRQGLREGERNLQCSEMQSRAHELIAATVVSIDPERGNVVLDLGKGGSAVLPRNEPRKVNGSASTTAACGKGLGKRASRLSGKGRCSRRQTRRSGSCTVAVSARWG